MEEYTIAKQVWRLSAVDLTEISRNSVLQSSFEPNVKAFWIGADYWKGGIEGNDIHRTNVPYRRVSYRTASLEEETRFVNDPNQCASPLVTSTSDPKSPSRAFNMPAGAGGPAGAPSMGDGLVPAMHLSASLPPPPPTVKSPRRNSKTPEYDGAFPRKYDPNEAQRLREAGRLHLAPSMIKDLEAHESGGGGGSGGRHANGSLTGRRLFKQETLMTYDDTPSHHLEIASRLDQQQALLEQAQAMAKAAEERAAAAIRLNRYILAGCVVAVVAMAVRGR